MSAEPLACPYCNALVDAAPGTPAGARVSCPRCGETFVLRHDAGGRPAADPASAAVPVPTTPGVRRTVLALVGLMVAMGVVTLVYGLSSQGFRRANDTDLNRPVERQPARLAGEMLLTAAVVLAGFVAVTALVRRSESGPRAGARWGWGRALAGVGVAAAVVGVIYGPRVASLLRGEDETVFSQRPKRRSLRQGTPEPSAPAVSDPTRAPGLGYLPPDYNVVAAVRVAELRQSATGRSLLTEPIRVGTEEVRLARLAGWVGLDADQIESFVVGLKAEEPLSALLVVRTRDDYNPGRVIEAVNAENISSTAGRLALYRFTVPGLNLPAYLWLADGRTLVAGLVQRFVVAVPATPRDGADHLPAAVQAVLRERVTPGAAAWAVGHVEDTSKTALPALLAQLPQEQREQLQRLRTFGAWLHADERLTLHAALRFAGADDAEAFAKTLARAKAEPALTTARDGAWLALQYRTDPEKLRRPPAER